MPLLYKIRLTGLLEAMQSAKIQISSESFKGRGLRLDPRRLTMQALFSA